MKYYHLTTYILTFKILQKRFYLEFVASCVFKEITLQSMQFFWLFSIPFFRHKFNDALDRLTGLCRNGFDRTLKWLMSWSLYA